VKHFLLSLPTSNKNEFTIGEDVDITYKENIMIISSENFATTVRSYDSITTRTQLTYEGNLLLRNYKMRPVGTEYKQQTNGISVALVDKQSDSIRKDFSIAYSALQLKQCF
jgi:hypothetical protein